MPEIRRPDVPDVILFLRALSVYVEDIVDFPHGPCGNMAVQPAFRWLRRMEALDKPGRLAEPGYRMAAIPFDVTLARMIERMIRDWRPEVPDPLLMGRSAFFVTEGRFLFPDEQRDGNGRLASPMRTAVSRPERSIRRRLACSDRRKSSRLPARWKNRG